jgi:hypothetical protein
MGQSTLKGESPCKEGGREGRRGKRKERRKEGRKEGRKEEREKKTFESQAHTCGSSCTGEGRKITVRGQPKLV